MLHARNRSHTASCDALLPKPLAGEIRVKQAKVTTVRMLWVPAVNNAGTWGRWAFIEITDPWDAQNTIRALLATAPDTAKGEPHAHAT